MVLKVYISGMSGNKEVKKRQQRVLMILDSKNIKYETIDITEPGRETDKEFMQNKSTSNGATVSDPEPRHALPPQIFNDEGYCGDYDAFDLANEIDTLEQFLKLEPPDTNTNTNTVTNATMDSSTEQIESKQENGETNGEDNKENDGSEPNKDDDTAEKPENRNNEPKISVEESISVDLQSTSSTEITESNDRPLKDQENQKVPLNEESEEILTTTTSTASTIDVTKQIEIEGNALNDKNAEVNRHESIVEEKKETIDSSFNDNGSVVIAEEKAIKKPKLDMELKDNSIHSADLEETYNAEDVEKFEQVSSDLDMQQENVENDALTGKTNDNQHDEFVSNVKLEGTTKESIKPLDANDGDTDSDKTLKKGVDNDDGDNKNIGAYQRLTTPPTIEKEPECDTNNKISETISN